ncbi:MAG: hypothetical protein KJ904_10960 [Alphaproteobacteria bacterium]|nr:hypothetical protein [Alphaproteobacteria bacterium]MBU0795620.1 hypothetical protein [Alphaproteobacteria bacterium]MBU0887677.1 hypothetical protein [Alphaproteobacteria bacterium]MBU1812896.1 hypothetical protein [Alphaproteobacteria bacterium]
MSLLTVTRFAPSKKEKPAAVESAPAPQPRRPVLRAIPDAEPAPAPRQTPAAAAAPASSQAAWLNAPSLSARGVSVPQYLRELDNFQRQHFTSEARKIVMDVSSREVEGVIVMAAKLRGRYLAKLLDAAGNGRVTVGETQMKEIQRCREMYDEAQRGIEELKLALESGEIAIPGMGRN